MGSLRCRDRMRHRISISPHQTRSSAGFIHDRLCGYEILRYELPSQHGGVQQWSVLHSMDEVTGHLHLEINEAMFAIALNKVRRTFMLAICQVR